MKILREKKKQNPEELIIPCAKKKKTKLVKSHGSKGL